MDSDTDTQGKLKEDLERLLGETAHRSKVYYRITFILIFIVAAVFTLSFFFKGELAYWIKDNLWLLFLLMGLALVTGAFGLLQGFSWRRYRRFKERIENVGSLFEDGSDSEQRAHREREEERVFEREFQRNLKSQIVLETFSLKGLDFYHPMEWRFQSQVNVLLGKNGYGKSHLLRGLAALAQAEGKVSSDFLAHGDDDVVATLGLVRGGKREQVVRQRLFFDASVSKVPLLAIPDTRFLNKSRRTIGSGADDKVDPARYGAYHFLNELPYEGVIETFLYQMCVDFISKRRRFRLAIFNLIREVVRELTDQSFDFHEIRPTGHGKFAIEVLTEGNEDFPLPIQKASQGTLSVLAIFSLIYNFLRSVHTKVSERDILDQTGIVIIDEIDAHLHPSWQQKIIGLLRRKFPNVQFVVTAHSPLVVAGCLAGEVAMLRKREDRFVLVQIEDDFVGAESADLYRDLFEVEELDENFLHYLTQNSLGEDHEHEINELESKENLSPGEERELARLHRLSRYTIRASEVKKRREMKNHSRIVADLQAEIRELERRLRSVHKEGSGQVHG